MKIPSVNSSAKIKINEAENLAHPPKISIKNQVIKRTTPKPCKKGIKVHNYMDYYSPFTTKVYLFIDNGPAPRQAAKATQKKG